MKNLAISLILLLSLNFNLSLGESIYGGVSSSGYVSSSQTSHTEHKFQYDQSFGSNVNAKLIQAPCTTATGCPLEARKSSGIELEGIGGLSGLGGSNYEASVGGYEHGTSIKGFNAVNGGLKNSVFTPGNVFDASGNVLASNSHLSGSNFDATLTSGYGGSATGGILDSKATSNIFKTSENTATTSTFTGTSTQTSEKSEFTGSETAGGSFGVLNASGSAPYAGSNIKSGAPDVAKTNGYSFTKQTEQSSIKSDAKVGANIFDTAETSINVGGGGGSQLEGNVGTTIKTDEIGFNGGVDKTASTFEVTKTSETTLAGSSGITVGAYDVTKTNGYGVKKQTDESIFKTNSNTASGVYDVTKTNAGTFASESQNKGQAYGGNRLFTPITESVEENDSKVTASVEDTIKTNVNAHFGSTNVGYGAQNGAEQGYDSSSSLSSSASSAGGYGGAYGGNGYGYGNGYPQNYPSNSGYNPHGQIDTGFARPSHHGGPYDRWPYPQHSAESVHIHGPGCGHPHYHHHHQHEHAHGPHQHYHNYGGYEGGAQHGSYNLDRSFQTNREYKEEGQHQLGLGVGLGVEGSIGLGYNSGYGYGGSGGYSGTYERKGFKFF